MPLQRRRRGIRLSAGAGTAAMALLAGCSGAGASSSGGGEAVNVLMVNNPQMVELQKLTADNFTKETGIKVNFTVLPENDVRDKISQDFSNQAGQYDVATISNFEVPFYAKNGWLHGLDEYAKKDTAFDQNDILKPLRESLTAKDGKLYAEPFYGESSFLMYRKDVFAKKGLTMPGEAHLAAGGRSRGQGGRRRERDEGHLPARAPRLGRGHRPAHHRRQHHGRHLVHPGLAGAAHIPGVQEGHPVLCRPGAGAR